MEAETKLHKRKFSNSLQSIKVMLANKRHTLSNEDWLILVDKMKQGIISQPHQYLSSEAESLPHETVTLLIEDIFDRFIKDQNARS